MNSWELGDVLRHPRRVCGYIFHKVRTLFGWACSIVSCKAVQEDAVSLQWLWTDSNGPLNSKVKWKDRNLFTTLAYL